MRSDFRSAREMAEDTAGRILLNLPVVFKSDLRSELRQQLMPFCLKMAEVSLGIEDIGRCLSMLVTTDVPDYIPESW